MTNLLNNCILTTYPEIVKYLSENNCGFELERAKMMRKKWVGGKIHPHLYSDLKEAVEKKVAIDID